MENLIKSAVEKTLKLAKIEGSITVTPSTISIEDIKTEKEAILLDKSFKKAGMKTLGYCDMNEIGMGNGFSLTIII